jgi:hypothetical protein
VSVAGATGNGAAEAYTASLWGMGLSHLSMRSQRPRQWRPWKAICPVPSSRGTVALPGPKTTSRRQGSHYRSDDEGVIVLE